VTDEVHARIVYWGVGGSGKTTNVRQIFARLRPDHRGELRAVPTRLDPTQTYDLLPIELGELQGARTRLQVVAVPGSPEHAPTRKQLLDKVDGIVFVVDTQRHRIDENVASLEELRSALVAYGRALELVPLVIQYNKRDLSDPFALEELHRKLAVSGAAAFEAVAVQGTGVLQTLTTVSKRVIRTRREAAASATAAAAAAARTAARTETVLDASYQEITNRLHAEAVAEAQVVEEAEIVQDLTIASVGEARRVGPRTVRIALVLRDEEGRELPMNLTLQLDPLLAPDPPGEG
jgi:signal recognition particle receptor subunit beta